MIRCSVLFCGSLAACGPGGAIRTGSAVGLTNSIGVELIRLQGGEFLMGHPEHRKPVHRVRVSGFSLSKSEITNLQWERLMPSLRCKESMKDDQPVVGVSKQEAILFAGKLSKLEGRSYRIPTDAEWEYAARGGLEQRLFPWGDGTLGSRAQLASSGTAPVGTFPANGFGLFDMAGNASEIVWDALISDMGFPANDGKDDPVSNPHDTASGAIWAVRGGNFASWAGFVFTPDPVASVRFPVSAADRELLRGIGLRLLLEEPESLQLGFDPEKMVKELNEAVPDWEATEARPRRRH